MILVVTLAAHLGVVVIRRSSERFLRSRVASEAKFHTVIGFASSLIVFLIYFGAFGFVLTELGVSLTTYLASASVIGLAVSFGSQGVVQDMITGLTVVFSDLLDVGDMVDIGGQVGIVERVGIRFTVLINFSGARVFIPNRSIGNVSNFPKGYIRAFLDVRLPEDPTHWESASEKLQQLAQAAYEQYPGILLLTPSFEGRYETGAGYSFLRFKFRIWPGQGAVIEQAVKASVVQSMKALDPGYLDWMVTVHYRAEPSDGSDGNRLPRPAVLRRAASRLAKGARPS